MSVHWVRELRCKPKLSCPPLDRPEVPRLRTITLPKECFESIGDYTRSRPTGPSEGRIYRKNHGWPKDMDDNWFVFLVVNAPDGNGQLHIPYTPVLT